MISMQTIDELAQRLTALLPPDLKEAREDIAANFRSALQATLSKFELVTREEFEVQRSVLLRTREKIEDLECQVAALEKALESTVANHSSHH